MEKTSFISQLIDGVATDGWEPTDVGFQLATHNFIVRLRPRSDTEGIEMLVANYDGSTILHERQKQGPDAAEDLVTLKLAYLYQQVQARPVDRVSQLDDVVREIKAGRGHR